MRRRRRRHEVGRHSFYSPVPVIDECSGVISNDFERADGWAPEFAARSVVSDHTTCFTATILTVQLSVISDVDITAYLADALVEIRFVSFLCANEISVDRLDATV